MNIGPTFGCARTQGAHFGNTTPALNSYNTSLKFKPNRTDQEKQATFDSLKSRLEAYLKKENRESELGKLEFRIMMATISLEATPTVAAWLNQQPEITTLRLDRVDIRGYKGPK